MSLWVYSLCHNNRLMSITLSGTTVEPYIKAGSKFYPYCQFSRVIISLNTKSPACNWFNCILPQLPLLPNTAQSAHGWQFLEHPRWALPGGISTVYSCRWYCWLHLEFGPPYSLGTENYLPMWPFLSLDSLDEMTFALNCSGFVSFAQPDSKTSSL